MDTKGFLDQLLRSGQSLGGGGTAAPGEAPGAAGLGGFGKGALAGGALGLLLGSKRMRKLGGRVALYGGIAGLGALAYRAYADWQRQQQGGGAQGEPRTVDRLQGAEADAHSRAILTAMLAAARSDGHIDDREQALIDQEVSRLADEPGLRSWLSAELRRPLDPANVASAASTPELAAEMYLASLLVVDEESFMERAYLDGLARELELDPDLKARLEGQARAGGTGA
jgi:uncharacterized membrane protein YebE (DUF533 family)